MHEICQSEFCRMTWTMPVRKAKIENVAKQGMELSACG